jgi:hypothetical protein
MESWTCGMGRRGASAGERSLGVPASHAHVSRAARRSHRAYLLSQHRQALRGVLHGHGGQKGRGKGEREAARASAGRVYRAWIQPRCAGTRYVARECARAKERPFGGDADLARSSRAGRRYGLGAAAPGGEQPCGAAALTLHMRQVRVPRRRPQAEPHGRARPRRAGAKSTGPFPCFRLHNRFSRPQCASPAPPAHCTETENFPLLWYPDAREQPASVPRRKARAARSRRHGCCALALPSALALALLFTEALVQR